MNRYDITVSWRLHVSKRERTERKIQVEAYNRDQALLFAGLRLGLDQECVYKPSFQIESVTRRRSL